jgi:hypothetical protein
MKKGEFHKELESLDNKITKEQLKNRDYHPLNRHPNIVKKYIERGNIEPLFSKNSSDLAVDYLFGNTDLIHWRYFVQNTNPRAVQYCIQKWDEIPEDYKTYFLFNKSQKAVDWIIHNRRRSVDNYYMKHNPINYSYNRFKYVQSKRQLFNDSNPSLTFRMSTH